jgi:hypothetical protein
LINDISVSFNAINKVAVEKDLNLAETIVAYIVISKLEIKTLDHWNEHNKNQIPTWSNLNEFLTSQAKILRNRPIIKKYQSSSSFQRHTQVHRWARFFEQKS